MVQHEQETNPPLHVTPTPTPCLEHTPVEGSLLCRLLRLLLLQQGVSLQERRVPALHVPEELPMGECPARRAHHTGEIAWKEQPAAHRQAVLFEARQRQAQRAQRGLQRSAERRHQRRQVVLHVTAADRQHRDLHCVEQRVDALVLGLHEAGGEVVAPVAQQAAEAPPLDGGLVHAAQQDLHVAEGRVQGVLHAGHGKGVQHTAEFGGDGVTA